MTDVKPTPHDRDLPVADPIYEAPTIVALGDVNTETLQTRTGG